ncbi:MAG: hypothetical protein EPO07_14820 [Verrucomicrobia bacterium]|nr:MAG: hypothetical protein EPO07_14820 [Verrucomicrobiota bacterium]
MNTPEQENFEKLRQALKLKQYELPPPRYFNEFSGRVVARIRAGEYDRQDSFADQAAMEAPWILRVFSVFQAKPIYAGVLATAACALLIGGVVLSEKPNLPMAASPADLQPEQRMLTAGGAGSVPFQAWAEKVNEANATNGAGSLFESLQPQGQIAPVRGFDSFRK